MCPKKVPSFNGIFSAIPAKNLIKGGTFSGHAVFMHINLKLFQFRGLSIGSYIVS